MSLWTASGTKTTLKSLKMTLTKKEKGSKLPPFSELLPPTPWLSDTLPLWVTTSEHGASIALQVQALPHI